MYRIEVKNKDVLQSNVILDVVKQVSNSLVSSKIHEYLPNNSIVEILVDPSTFSGNRINDFLSVDIKDLIQGEFLEERLYAFQLSLTDVVCMVDEVRKPIMVRIHVMNNSSIPHHDMPEDEDAKESSTFEAVDPKYNLRDIILTDKTREQIDRAIALIQNQTKIFKEWGFEKIDPFTKTILCFYGKPGTGKTMCAHGLASALGKKLIIASYASIESKWVGEGPKNLKKVFHDSMEQDAILFFDEADSFLSKRIGNADTGSDKHYNRMSNEMFQLLENHNGIVIFATNMVTDFDKAFKSRILAFIELELPDRDTRAKIIHSMILPTIPLAMPLSELEILQLSDILDGFSGRDIRKAILTTLSDGAMRGVSEFCYDNFQRGFYSIKEDIENIDKTISGSGTLDNAVTDFIRTSDENSAILDICLNVILQADNVEPSAKKELQSICKNLNIEMPDLRTVSYAKDISTPSGVLKGTDRVVECMRYCCSLLALNNMEDNMSISYISELADALGVNNIVIYNQYYELIKKMKS